MIRILLAEDDLFLRDIYTEILQDEGFAVTIAVDGEEALKKIKKAGWDLVLLDMLMPKLSGIDVLRMIKKEKLEACAKHVVIMTNSDEKKGIEDVLGMVDGYLLKSSFTPGELIEQLKKYLKN